jgi:3-hydroxyacyl-CoA dehydrogenase / enoyl-CoA hydratase / 3-hydroxybutyryl-CoA epimerase
MIRYEKDPDNIVTLTLDMEGQKHNIISHDIGKSFLPVLKHLKGEKAKGLLRGVIITSAKKHFLVGGDLEFLYETYDAEALFQTSQTLSQFFRDLESPGVPVVAAINGTALGPGFELALACHHRIAIKRSNIKLGLPETSYGLMPSGGASIRLLWLLGLEQAYHILTNGHSLTPEEALHVGIIDELADNEKDLIERAKDWLLGHRDAKRTWDTEGECIPVPSAVSTRNDDMQAATGNLIRKLTAELYKKYYNNYPAYQAVLSTLAEATKLDFDTACRIQSRYFAYLVTTKEAKNMIKAFWFDNNSIKRGENRPKGYGKFRPRKIGIIGAGLMGSGIAFVCVKAGLHVVLKDISRSVAEKGKEHSAEKLFDLVKRNELTEAEAKEMLSRIVATEQIQALEDCDLIIEAVFENQMLKSKIIKEAEVYLDQYCIIASNTSSIPITKLGKTTIRPANFCGMRFFRPVDDEPLVEIVKGEKTSDETIARAFDFIKLINKIPIVAKDSWGFYAGRVRNTYILEGIAMLQEGYPAALIENMGLQSGMPYGPLAWADDLSLDLIAEYEHQASELYGPKYIKHPATATLELMISENRTGKDKRAGFYAYDKNGHRKLWSQLQPNGVLLDYNRAELTQRLLFVQVIEAFWCLQEGIIHSEAEANLGSIYGWSFPACKGGVVQYVTDYGKSSFLARCEAYRLAHGQRFRLPKLLSVVG